MYDNLTRTNLEFAYRKAEKRIEELEKENAELQERYNKVDIIGYDALKNLAKAKEIIRKLMDWYWETDICSDTMPQELRQNAEQFLKEIEK